MPYEGTKQAFADAIVAAQDFTDGDSFFIVAADEDARQVASVFHYKVNRRVSYAHVDDIASKEDLREAARGCDWIVVLEEDPRLEELVGPPGAYRLEADAF